MTTKTKQPKYRLALMICLLMPLIAITTSQNLTPARAEQHSPKAEPDASAAPTLEAHKWTITNIGPHDGKHLGFITFSNGQLEGQSTCNSFSAVYKSGDENSLTIFAVGATQLICQVGDKMEIEAAFLADLEAVQRYQFSNDMLILYKENDVEIARLK